MEERGAMEERVVGRTLERIAEERSVVSQVGRTVWGRTVGGQVVCGGLWRGWREL